MLKYTFSRLRITRWRHWKVPGRTRSFWFLILTTHSSITGLVLCTGCRIKRYSKIDQHLVPHSKYNGECLSYPPPFLFSQIITYLPPFLIQWSRPIRRQGCNFSQLWNPYTYPYSSSIIEFLLSDPSHFTQGLKGFFLWKSLLNIL